MTEPSRITTSPLSQSYYPLSLNSVLVVSRLHGHYFILKVESQGRFLRIRLVRLVQTFHMLSLHSQYEYHIHRAVSIVSLLHRRERMHVVCRLTPMAHPRVASHQLLDEPLLARRNAPQEDHRKIRKKRLARVLL